MTEPTNEAAAAQAMATYHTRLTHYYGDTRENLVANYRAARQPEQGFTQEDRLDEPHFVHYSGGRWVGEEVHSAPLSYLLETAYNGDSIYLCPESYGTVYVHECGVVLEQTADKSPLLNGVIPCYLPTAAEQQELFARSPVTIECNPNGTRVLVGSEVLYESRNPKLQVVPHPDGVVTVKNGWLVLIVYRPQEDDED